MQQYIEQLTKSRQLLMEEVEPLTAQQLNESLVEGKWTIAQICKHIIMAERLFLDAIKEAYKTKGTEEQLIHSHYISFEKVYDDSIKYKAPTFVQPEAHYYSKEAIKEELEQCRLDVMTTLQSIQKKSIFEKYVYPHYIFGPLTIGKWFELMAVHEQRHIRQIKELKLQVVT